MVPARVGPYRVIRCCGAGGMGEVYLAQDTRLERLVALKFLLQETPQDKHRRQRFFSEARAAAALAHPNICTVYEVAETEEGLCYIAMEWLEGPTLRERLAASRLPWDEILAIGIQVAEALEAAHAQGIIHRDIKPANVSLAASGWVKVLDFGLAKWQFRPEPTPVEEETRTTQWQTEVGQIMGTPGYMSPEQAKGQAVDARTDLFSLGVMLYEMSTGQLPFGGNNREEMLRNLIERQPEPVPRLREEVPAEFERMLIKCLQKDPGARYQSARELRIDLAALRSRLASPAGNASGQVLTLLCLEVLEAQQLKASGRLQEAAQMVRQQQAKLHNFLKETDGRVEPFGDILVAELGRPSEAVQLALRTVLDGGPSCHLGLHLGEVMDPRQTEPLRRYGAHLETAVRLMQLAEPGHVFMSRGVFDSARIGIRCEDNRKIGDLSWVSHGPYAFIGMEESLEVCEVGLTCQGPLNAPPTNEKATRLAVSEADPVLGWRPAVGQQVPNTNCVLEEKLGEGGFGEVWRASHQDLNEKRVFKFCFRADRVRSLKREVTLFRLMKERAGEHPNIVRLYDIFFDQPPYYLEEEYVPGKDLRSWCEAQGGATQVPLKVRLELIAQAADALQAAHDAGVIHRDVKPGNILVSRAVDPEEGKKISMRVGSAADSADPLGSVYSGLRAKLTDFGIGQVVSSECLSGANRAGFTLTMIGPESSSHTGTQLYMAPEIQAGKSASTRSDIYSLGVVLYQLLVGDFQRPLAGDWSEDISDPLLRDDLRHCLAGKPQDRFAAAALLAKNLRSLPERQAALERDATEKQALEQAAYRRGVIRTAAFASVVITVISILAWQVWSNALAKSRLSRQIRSNAVRLTVAKGLSYAENGDRFTANLWFSEAFAIEGIFKSALDPQLSRLTHQLRINLLSRQLPLLEQMWFDTDSISGGFDPTGQQVLLGGTNGYGLYRVESGQSTGPRVGAGHEWARLSPDGKRVATGGGDTNSLIELWDTSSGARLSELLAPGNESSFRGNCGDLQFSPDGRWIVGSAVGGGGLVIIWDAETMRVQRTILCPKEPGARLADGIDILSAHFDLSGERLVITDTAGRAVIWHWKNSSAPRVLQAHESFVYNACFGRCHTNWLLTCSFDRTARLWDLETGQRLLQVQHEGDAVSDIAFSPNDKMFATSSLDSTVRLWDSETGRLLPPILRAHDRVMKVQWSADGKRVLVVTSDGVNRVWNYVSQKPVVTRTTSDFSRDGRLALDEIGQTIQLSDRSTGGGVGSQELPSDTAAWCFAGGPERFLLFMGSPNGASAGLKEVRMREFAAPRSIGSPLACNPSWSRFVCAADGSRVAFFGGDEWGIGAAPESGVVVWEPRNGPDTRSIAFKGETVNSVALDSKGRWMAIGSVIGKAESGVLRLLDLQAQDEPAVLLRCKSRIAHLAFSGDGEWMVAACADDTLNACNALVWRVPQQGFPVIQPLSLPHSDGVLCAEFSDNSQMMATGSEDQSAVVWYRTKSSWQALGRPLRCDEQVYTCAFSHNGRWLATANRARAPQPATGDRWRSQVRIWDIANSEAICLPFIFSSRVTRLGFLAGDSQLFVEQWIPPALPQRWLIDLSVKDDSVTQCLRRAELLSAQRSFISRGPEPLSEALAGILAAEEAPHRAASTGPRGTLNQEDCRGLWLQFSTKAESAF